MVAIIFSSTVHSLNHCSGVDRPVGCFCIEKLRGLNIFFTLNLFFDIVSLWFTRYIYALNLLKTSYLKYLLSVVKISLFSKITTHLYKTCVRHWTPPVWFHYISWISNIYIFIKFYVVFAVFELFVSPLFAPLSINYQPSLTRTSISTIIIFKTNIYAWFPYSLFIFPCFFNT